MIVHNGDACFLRGMVRSVKYYSGENRLQRIKSVLRSERNDLHTPEMHRVPECGGKSISESNPVVRKVHIALLDFLGDKCNNITLSELYFNTS